MTTLNVDVPGYHTVKVLTVDPGVVLEKIVVEFAAPRSLFKFRHAPGSR